MNEIRTKTFSFAAVAVILCAGCAGFFVTDEQEQEPDALAPIIVAFLFAGAFTGSGFAIGWMTNDYVDSGDTDVQPYLRLAAANDMADIMSVAYAFTSNAHANYSQIWGMTKEHWMRQAELEVYSKWQSGQSYDSAAILSGARIFENNEVMTANAVAQINSFLDDVSAKIADWGTKDTYYGKMKAGFLLDNLSHYSDHEQWNADLVSVAEVSGTAKLHIGTVTSDYIITAEDYTPGYVYNFGPATTVTSDSGLVYVLNSGKNYLSDLRSTVGSQPFQDGSYTVSDAVIGGDTLCPLMGSGSVSLKAGFAVTKDGELSLLTLDGGSVRYGHDSFEKVLFGVVPQEIPSGEQAPEPVDFTPVLKGYQSLLDRIYWTSVAANSSASAVWNLYDRADAKDYNVSTLMASNVYDSVVLSPGMNEVLTLSAMQQLASYYGGHETDLSGLEIGLYSDNMDAPFVRGSIEDRFGNTVYDDVIFTPFFQSEDTRLEIGSDYTVEQNTLVAVWADGQELVSWNGTADDCETVFLDQGYTFRIAQLASYTDGAMRNQSSVDFKVTKVNYIDPSKVKLSEDSDTDSGTRNLVKLVFVIGGVVLLLLGIAFRRLEFLILGAVLIIFGLVFAEPVFNALSKLGRT